MIDFFYNFISSFCIMVLKTLPIIICYIIEILNNLEITSQVSNNKATVENKEMYFFISRLDVQPFSLVKISINKYLE